MTWLSAPSPLRRAPGSVFGAVLAATVVFLTTSVALGPALAGLGGVASVTAGVLFGRRSLITVGAATSFGAVILAGIAGADPLLLLVGACGTMLAWDLGGFAIDLEDSFEPAAAVGTLASVHNMGVLVFVTATGIAVFTLSRIPVGNAPGIASLLLIAGGILIVAALR